MTTAERIAKIDAKIDAIIDDPLPSYKIGDKEMKWNDYYKWLLSVRQDILANGDAEFGVVEFAGMELDEMGMSK